MMKHSRYKSALLSALLLLLSAAGFAAQDPAQAGKPKAAAAANAPAVAASASSPAATATPQAGKTAHPLPAPSAIETQTGIQIAQVGITASGGLVDVRFKVLDAAKAKALLGDPANAPQLVVGDQPPLMAPHHALRGARFAQGQVFYILYPNQRQAVKPGVPVTVALGQARLGPVKAQ
jgi:pyruvate/2-oxoglutarate dehydrogenase complex dihydrolipoamide acyltransferase (E2) component